MIAKVMQLVYYRRNNNKEYMINCFEMSMQLNQFVSHAIQAIEPNFRKVYIQMIQRGDSTHSDVGKQHMLAKKAIKQLILYARHIENKCV